jgi:ribosomal protein L37E
MARCSNCGRREGESYTVHSTETFMTGQETYSTRDVSHREITGEVRKCPDCRDWFCSGCMVGNRCYECDVKLKEIERNKLGWWYCEKCGRQKEPTDKKHCSVCGVWFCGSCGYGYPTQICFECNRKKG